MNILCVGSCLFLLYLIVTAVLIYRDPTQERMGRLLRLVLAPAVVALAVITVVSLIGIGPFITPMPADD